jgi:endo-1,4-beta-mannosidase
MKALKLKQIIKEEISKVLKEESEMSGLLNRLDKNKSLKVGDVTTIRSGKYKGKKVKIVADLGGGSYGLEFVS